MEKIYIKKIKEAKKAIPTLKRKLKLKIEVKGRVFTIIGDSLEEYEAQKILDAINFGFSSDKALTLTEEDIDLRILHIRDFTRRKNLKEVRARLIGTHGKTKKTIEKISSCALVINENEIGLIGDVDSIEEATTAITNIIKGSKQTNAYKYLERINKEKKNDGLGLK